jgi:hypothetical protein
VHVEYAGHCYKYNSIIWTMRRGPPTGKCRPFPRANCGRRPTLGPTVSCVNCGYCHPAIATRPPKARGIGGPKPPLPELLCCRAKALARRDIICAWAAFNALLAAETCHFIVMIDRAKSAPVATRASSRHAQEGAMSAIILPSDCTAIPPKSR